MKNECITENLAHDTLLDLAYFAESSDIRVEEQKSNIEAVERLCAVPVNQDTVVEVRQNLL